MSPIDIDLAASRLEPNPVPIRAEPAPTEPRSEGRQSPPQRCATPFCIEIGPQERGELISRWQRFGHGQVRKQSNRLTGVDRQRLAVDFDLWGTKEGN